MSALRRRFFGDSSSSISSSRELTPEKADELRLVSAAKLHDLKHKTSSKRRNWILFGLGGLFGVLCAGFFAQQQDVINFDGLLDLNLENLVDVIPAGILKDAKELSVSALANRPGYWSRYRVLIILSNTNVMLSTTIPSPSDCTCNRRASVPCIQSSWYLESFQLD